MKQLGNEFEFRKILLKDSDVIESLIQEGLGSGGDFFLPLLPTKHNAKVFFATEVRHLIINEDPCFIAFKEGVAAGFSCCSTGINTAYELSKPIALGCITVTRERFRRMGLASLLRGEMLKELKLKGIKFVLSDIAKSNLPSEAGCKKIAKQNSLNFKEISIKYECEI